MFVDFSEGWRVGEEWSCSGCNVPEFLLPFDTGYGSFQCEGYLMYLRVLPIVRVLMCNPYHHVSNSRQASLNVLSFSVERFAFQLLSTMCDASLRDAVR